MSPTEHLNRRKPWWMQQDQGWAEEHVTASHVDALYRYGEFCMFTLLWTSQDSERGEVGPCSFCVTSNPLAVGYGGQATDQDCSHCFGTGYEGGFRARIVRPAIVSDRDADTKEDQHLGEVTTETLNVQTTADFYVRTGDFMFRQDGTRYRLAQMETEVIRSGFDHPGHEETVGGVIRTATLESDVASRAHLLPPSAEEVRATLQTASMHRHIVTGLARLDIIRAPLVPASA